MHLFSDPRWIDQQLLRYNSLDEVSAEKIDAIKERLQSVVSNDPLVSVIIAAWNEELNIIKCLDSLSKSKTDIPFEIIVINNNSNDGTQEVIDKLGVISYLQPAQGVGPSRELGQQKAKGKYILSADADCVYPERWIDIMTKTLMKTGNVFVYGRFSYLSDDKHPRWQLFFYELVRDLMSEMRHVKRPYLNTYGISLGYIRELGLQVGHISKNMRGFDGRLCFDIMKHGKVAVIRSASAKAWTGTRALDRDGSFFDAIVKRVFREFARLDDYFKRPQDHNTKESQNADYSVKNSVKTIKKKLNPFHSSKK
ncbi:MAG TPA: glycosyltransferase family 2 protein [Ohtaekwangia sp.]|nr:glycosyltransferase family 2 protein [Ohtaekwangia sp.]